VFKRILALLALVFGFLGLIACLAGVYIVLLVGSRLQETNEKVFTAVSKGLVFAQDRLQRVQKRVADSKITDNEIAERIREWGKKEAKERLIAQLDIESRTEKLGGHLQTADLWLDSATESIRGVQQVLELAHSIGAQVDPSSLEESLEKLASIRKMLQETEGEVENIRKLAANKDSETEDSRTARILELLGRVLLTISDIDVRLDEFQGRLTNLQTSALHWKARMHNYILLATVTCNLLVVWIAAGQAALFLTGWKNCRRSRTPV
jgi:hypothetical protein